LVVGDIVQIKAGDKVPADLRLFEVNQGKVEKSGLTGESEPIPLSVTSADPNLYETKNLALFGTSLLEGSAAGMVINTSDRTVMGKIARVASGTSSVSTSLQKEVNYFTGLVGLMALILCIIVIFGYYFGVSPSHQGFLTVSSVITNCIAVVVSLLPEGAPVSLALILKLVAKRMFSVNILVKKLTVLETLGSATLIASDKTGTLTQNRMTLNHLWIANDHKEDLANGGDKRRKKSKFQQRDNFDVQETTSGCYGLENIGKHLSEPALNYLCQMMCLCNKTVFEDEEDENENQPKYRQADKNNGPRKIVGNPTEGALLNAAEEYLDTRTLREFTPMIREIAFSSRTKYHLTIHKIDDEQLFQNSQDAIRPTEKSGSCSFVIFLKGAPEYVLGMCSKAVVNGTEVNVDPSLVHRIM
jgi:sodium/potassium-transporting ATPase subunit alpha